MPQVQRSPERRGSLARSPALAAKRRALAFGYEGEHFTLEEWLALLEFYGGRCLRCGTPEDLSVDHVIPLVSGARTP
jgi:5-methylcytosine-specific restriction endonuclease McrA